MSASASEFLACGLLTAFFYSNFNRFLRIGVAVSVITMKLTLSFCAAVFFFLAYKLRAVGINTILSELQRVLLLFLAPGGSSSSSGNSLFGAFTRAASRQEL